MRSVMLDASAKHSKGPAASIGDRHYTMGYQLSQQLHRLQPHRQLQPGNGRVPAPSQLLAQGTSNSTSSSSSMGLPQQYQQHVQGSVYLPGMSQQQHTRQSVACEAMFGWWGGSSKASSSSRLAERPLYNKREVFDLGGLQVSPMGLGTWAWGNQFLWGYDPTMDAELQEVFNLVVASGVNIFDTADSYGTGKLNGRSEELLGQFIREYPGSEQVSSNLHVATKFAAYPWRITPGNIVAACKGSLRRTGLEQISLGQLHWSAAKYAPLQEWALWNGLSDCYEQGLVKAVGVSNYGAKELRRVARDFGKRGVPLASAQVQYSLLSSGPAQSSTKAAADDLGIVLIAYSPLALGLLTGKYSMDCLPPGPRGNLFRQLLPGIQPVLNTLEVVASSRRKTMSQVAINWCMCKGTLPIPGAKDLAQAQENLGALGWRLSSGEVAELDAAVGRCTKQALQNIFQTA